MANVSTSIQWLFLFFLSQCKFEAGKEIRVFPGGNLWNPEIGRLVLAAFLLLPRSFTTLQEKWCRIPRTWAACQSAPYSSFPAVNSCTRWQWVRWSHMPVFGARHKVPDCNICLEDKWRKCFERANRNKRPEFVPTARKKVCVSAV